MARAPVIQVRIPSSLAYRDVAIRLVASVCKLVPGSWDAFQDEVISAFSEALNNVVLHGGAPPGALLELDLELGEGQLTIRLRDYGKSFDPRTAPEPDLASLPESGMGTFIIRSFMDEIAYQGGSPNTLTMTKYVRTEQSL